MNKYLALTALSLSLLPLAAHSQDATATTTTTTTTTTTVTTPTAPANPFEITPSPDSERLDYHLLYNNTFNRVDLSDAQADHLSDRQIAKIYVIARNAGVEFREVFALVKDGYSFEVLSGWYGVNLGNHGEIDKAQDDIDAYEEAYAATGLGGAPRPGRVESSIDSVRH